jgi:hypothetical protein
MKRHPANIEAATRRRLVVDLRRAGATYGQIADEVRRIYEAEGKADILPRSYNALYAHRDFTMAFQQATAQLRESVEQMRELEYARLDEMFNRIYPRVLGTEETPPDLSALDRALKIMERRARLAGLDSPFPVDLRQLTDAQLVALAAGRDPRRVIEDAPTDDAQTLP